jgi:hypothetical protein
MANTVNISVSLPSEQVALLNTVHSRMRISRSALVSSILGEALPRLDRLTREVLRLQSDPTDPQGLRRLRDAAGEILHDEIADLLRQAGFKADDE